MDSHPVTISVAEAGEYVEATDLYTAHDGEWVHVPLVVGGPGGWTRPDDWLATSVTTGEQKIQILVAVGPNTTVETDRAFTVRCLGATTIDWGDGSAPENFASNAIAKHIFDPTSLTTTSDGWKQALVTITQQGAGTFSSLDLSQVYYAAKIYRTPAIEIVVGPPLTSLILNTFAPMLQRVELKSPLAVSVASVFSGCSNLREIVGQIDFSGAGTTGAFATCVNLAKFPTMTFAGSCTNFSTMFSLCGSMTELPAVIPWSQVINTANMFVSCYQLGELPVIDLSSATTVTTMFQGCTSLRRVNIINMAAVTSIASMFGSCTSLEEVTGVNCSGTTAAAGYTNAFQNDYRLSRLGFTTGGGPKFTFTVASANFDGPGLDKLYGDLATVSGQTITVSSVPGGLADTPTIATAKGWTVTGS